jgi:chromosome segregation ATPase
MSEQNEGPTLADVLAAIEASRAEATERFDRLEGRADATDAALASLARKTERIAADVAQLRADVAAVKVDTGFLESFADDSQTAIRRHLGDPDAHRRAA